MTFTDNFDPSNTEPLKGRWKVLRYPVLLLVTYAALLSVIMFTLIAFNVPGTLIFSAGVVCGGLFMLRLEIEETVG